MNTNASRSIIRLVFLAFAVSFGPTACGPAEPTANKGHFGGMGPIESALLIGDQDGWTGNLENGQYRLVNTTDPDNISYFWTPLDQSQVSSREVSVDVRIENSVDGNGRAGLLYAFQEEPRFFYSIMINDGGMLEVHRFDDSGYNLIISSSYSVSGDFTRLKLLEEGNQLSFYSNGKQLGSISGSGTGQGALGIAALGLGSYAFTNYSEIES